MATRPSTWRVYQFRHQRVVVAVSSPSRAGGRGSPCSAPKRRGHDDGQPREVPLDDVGAALRAGEKPIPPKPASRPECMSTSATGPSRAAPGGRRISRRHGARSSRAMLSAASLVGWLPVTGRGRMQRLLVTGDNRLKQGVGRSGRARATSRRWRWPARPGWRTAVRPLVESGSPISSGSLENRLDALGLER